MTNSEHVEVLSAVLDRAEAHDAPVVLLASDENGLPLTGDGFQNLSEVLDAHPTIRVAHAHCAGNVDDESIELWLQVGDFG